MSGLNSTQFFWSMRTSNVRTSICAVALLFSISTGTTGQETFQQRSVERRLRTHIEYLASDKLEGRRTGEPGAVLAAEYIAEQFKSLKLKDPDRSRKGILLQEFPYVTGVEAAADNEFNLYYFDSGSTRSDGTRPVAFSPNG